MLCSKSYIIIPNNHNIMYLLACLLENMLKVGIKYVGKRFSHIIYSASILYHSSKISD